MADVAWIFKLDSVVLQVNELNKCVVEAKPCD